MKNVCVIGLGFVGLTLALALAKRNFKVIGIEKNNNLLNNLKRGRPNFFEPDLENQLKKNIKNKKLSIFLRYQVLGMVGLFYNCRNPIR